MKNEEIKPVNPEDYKKEFATLNYLYENLDFSIYESAVFCESNFFDTIAWYIESLKEQHDPSGWEEPMQKTIDEILKYDDDAERFKFSYYLFGRAKAEWFKTHGWEQKAKMMEKQLSNTRGINWCYERTEEGKIRGIFPGMIKEAIPQWYWTWSDMSGLEKKIINQNHRSFVNALRHGMNRNDRSNDDD